MTLAPAAPAEHAGPRGSSALLRDPTFGPFFAGNLVSNCGTWFQNVAAAVVVFNLTRSALLVGAVSVMQFLPSLVLAPWAGAVTDRVDRRRLLLASQLLSAAAAGGLAVWTALVGVEGLPGPWPVLAAALVIGVGYAFSVPAMQALVPALVPPRDLDAAIALNSVTFNVARAVGPALGAVALVALGPAAAFGVNTVSFLALIVALIVIRPRAVERRTGGDGSVREGLRYVRADRTTLLLLIGVTGLGFGTDPVNTLSPPMAAALGGSDALVGWLVSAFGFGAAASAFGVRAVRRRVSLERLGPAGLALLAAGMVGFAASPGPVAAILSLAMSGVGFLLAITALTTRIQLRIEDSMRGRVMALWSVAFLGSRPVAALVNGGIGDLVGPRAGVAVAAAITLAMAVVVRRAPADG